MKSVNRRCSHCRKKVPASGAVIGGLRAFCSYEHLIAYARSDKGAVVRSQAERADTRERKQKLKTKSDYMREAQREFNRWVRLRDKDEPCICCGKHHQGQYHAGHYLSVGAHPNLRFDEANVHKQSSYCNNHKSGNQAEYRIRLIEKIGLAEVERLEADQIPRKYTVEQIKGIRDKYRKLANALESSDQS